MQVSDERRWFEMEYPHIDKSVNEAYLRGDQAKDLWAGTMSGRITLGGMCVYFGDEKLTIAKYFEKHFGKIERKSDSGDSKDEEWYIDIPWGYFINHYGMDGIEQAIPKEYHKLKPYKEFLDACQEEAEMQQKFQSQLLKWEKQAMKEKKKEENKSNGNGMIQFFKRLVSKDNGDKNEKMMQASVAGGTMTEPTIGTKKPDKSIQIYD